MLSPHTAAFANEDFTQGLGGSIYSEQQMRIHRYSSRVVNSRGAILTKIANDAIGGAVPSPNGGYQLGPPMDLPTIEKLRMDFLGSVFPLLPLLGQAWHWFTGGLLLLGVLKVLLGCSIRIYRTYQAKGYFGCWVFGALWGTIFSVGMVPLLALRAILQMVEHPDPKKPEQMRAREDILRAVKRGGRRDSDNDDDDNQGGEAGTTTLERARRAGRRGSSLRRYTPAPSYDEAEREIKLQHLQGPQRETASTATTVTVVDELEGGREGNSGAGPITGPSGSSPWVQGTAELRRLEGELHNPETVHLQPQTTALASAPAPGATAVLPVGVMVRHTDTTF